MAWARIKIIMLLTVLSAFLPARAELGDIKALIIGLNYLNDQAPTDGTRSYDVAYLGLSTANADARRVLCSLHPRIRSRASVFIEGEAIDPARLSRRDCDKPRRPFKDAAVGTTPPTDLFEVVYDFVDTLDPDDTAFVYIAGHAFELEGNRWLLPPVPARYGGSRSVSLAAPKPRLFSISDDLVFPVLDLGQRLVLTLDACRTDFSNDPLRDRVLTFYDLAEDLEKYIDDDGEIQVSLARGLTTFNVEGYEGEDKSVTFFFSAAPGQTASDTGDFARHYARELSRRQPLTDVMRNTQAALRRDPSNDQEPFIQTNDGSDDVYMRGASLSPSP